MDKIAEFMAEHKMKDTRVEHLGERCDGCGRDLQRVTITFEDDSEKVNLAGCMCEANRKAQERQRELNARDYDRFSVIQNEYLEKSFDNYIVNSDDEEQKKMQSEALKFTKHYALNFGSHLKEKQNLFIQGTFGTGKTHLAAAIRNEVSKQNYKVLFISLPNYIEALKKEFRDKSNHHSIYKWATEADLLILDDVGANRMNEFAISELFRLVDARIDKCTVYTTNMTSEEFTQTKELNRILSRMVNRAKAIVIKGTDYRRKGLM